MKPLDEFLSRIKNVKVEGEKQWSAQCPCHDDQKNSLSVSEGEDGKVLIHCHAGCNTGLICHAAGMAVWELFPDHGKTAAQKKAGKGKVVVSYDYYDADQVLRYQVCRMDPKDFRQRRPDGKDGWIWNMSGVTRVLYRLPELLKSDEAVLVPEGEKDCDRLAGLGFTATTNPGGAGKWLKAYARWLIGRDVVILPDNDPPGLDHAQKIVAALAGIARSIKILCLPDLKAKGDVSDWLDAGGTKERLVELITGTTTADPGKISEEEVARRFAEKAEQDARNDPDSDDFEEATLCDIGLDVLGEVESEKYAAKVFSEYYRKSDLIYDVGKLSYERLLQLAGPIVKLKVCKGNEPEEGQHTMAEVRKAIALFAGRRRITDETEVGLGVWRGIDKENQPDDAVVLVGAGEAAKWNSTLTLERVTKPRVDGLLVDIGQAEPWYNYAILAPMVADCTKEWAHHVLAESEALFERWRWKQPEAPLIVTGLILATWLQTIWAWRPQVAIIGQSNSGKSTLFEALAGIFGRLALRSSQSSAAGIRQAVRQSSVVILADEFESGRHRSDILEMLRASGRGDTVLRGTAGGQRGLEFTLRHVAWVAGIESGLKREPDRNRFITLELLTPKPEDAGKLVLPPAQQLNQLGQKMLAVCIRYGLASQAVAVTLKSKRVEGLHPRVIESYAVPAAIVATVLAANEEQATAILARMLKAAESDESAGDEEALMDDILSSTVCVDKEQHSVSQLIQKAKTKIAFDDAFNGALERVGIAIFENMDKTLPDGSRLVGDYLFVAHKVVLRHLLWNTAWAGQRIDQILCRIDGAKRYKTRYGSSESRGILVPMK